MLLGSLLVVQRMQLGRAAGKGGGFVHKKRFVFFFFKKKKCESVKSGSRRREQTQGDGGFQKVVKVGHRGIAR